jgi:hypothetical protein
VTSGCGFVVEIGNPHRTFDSYEVSSKYLEDEGALKEPLPFLKSIMWWGWGHFMCLSHPWYQAPWGLLSPNNPLTSHLDGEERVGAARAMANVTMLVR